MLKLIKREHNLEKSSNRVVCKRVIESSWSHEKLSAENNSVHIAVSYAASKLINSRNRIKFNKSAEEQKPVHPFAANDYCC